MQWLVQFEAPALVELEAEEAERAASLEFGGRTMRGEQHRFDDQDDLDGFDDRTETDVGRSASQYVHSVVQAHDANALREYDPYDYGRGRNPYGAHRRDRGRDRRRYRDQHESSTDSDSEDRGDTGESSDDTGSWGANRDRGRSSPRRSDSERSGAGGATSSSGPDIGRRGGSGPCAVLR